MLSRHSSVNAEFLRILMKPMVSKFFSQLDQFSDKLIQIFRNRGGVKDQKIKYVLAIDNSRDIFIRRECILKSLIIYLSEDPDAFLKEYLATAIEESEMDIASTVMGIYVICRPGDKETEDVGVVIEGVKVLINIGGVIMASIMLFGLIYALDLSFPEDLKYTFKFSQKIIMNLDGHKLNAKIQQLKIKLFA